MSRRVRLRRPSPGTVLASLALMVALSGTAVGESAISSAKKLISGKQIKDNSVSSRDIRNNSIRSGDVRDGSLLARDFAAGQIPAGAKGDTGLQGLQGPKGDTGLQGAKGDTGLQGPTGEQGVQGDTGPAGPLVQADDWNEVGDADGPHFDHVWIGSKMMACGDDDAPGVPSHNLDGNHSSAAFYRDPWGVVRLKGVVTAHSGYCDWIFQLPAGYRPAKRSVFAAYSNNTLGRINVGTVLTGGQQVPGIVQAEVVSAWISLDGISFRCAPRGQDGCP